MHTRSKRTSYSLVILASLLQLMSADFGVIRNKRQAEFLEKEVKDFIIVTPEKITAHGKLVTYDVRHRAKRSLHPTTTSTVHYRVPLPGRDLLLNLRANSKLLSPGFVVERIRDRKTRSITRRGTNTGREKHCLFEGHVNDTEESYVALSACNGLTGLVHLDNDDYFIEPVKGHLFDDHVTQPHVVYKTSVVRNFRRGETCGVDADLDARRKEEVVTSGGRRGRRRRSVSKERNVETLIVADKEMMNYYADEDIETYILTIINMVSTLYHDASIGNAINIVLVRVILLEGGQLQMKKKEADDLVVSQHADNTLKSFCRWQKFVNPKDENHPNHHDVAILLTRYNICSKTSEPCSTLGLAEVAGMCQPQRSCNVNEDTGLALAYTIAHELGHNFGMSHDSPQNGCQATHGEKQYVMSPHLNSDSSPFSWSNCSRGEITEFLDRDWGNCLDDEPSEHEFPFPDLPPGAMYDADHQCRLQYGPDAEHCEGIEDVCQTLWCRNDSKCVTRLEPSAEGTLCDKNKWCYMGVCTLIGERPNAIDGNWGSWYPWSICSRSCGAGVRTSERHCDNPAPAWGGRFCTGERRRYKICNTEKCNESSPSYRALQCMKFNDIEYKGELHSWLPVSTPMTPCQLHCKPDGQFFSVMLAETVEDGTECNPGTRDICINGKCRRVACDWEIESKAQEDRCGVCHGDGTQCFTVKGAFRQKIGSGYVSVFSVPRGARNIRVEEIFEATNFIAIQGEEGNFYLNGQWFIQWSGEFPAAGTTFYYQRDRERETLQIPGPIAEKIHVMLLYQTENPGLTYEYTVPNKSAVRKPLFGWKYSDWTTCSITCGGGMQTSVPECWEKESGLVEESYCDVTDKPVERTRACNLHECPARWWTGPWQQCSVTCGGKGTRQRTVICIRSFGSVEQMALLEEECGDNERPVASETCHNDTPCRTNDGWDVGKWTDVCKDDPCNYQTREVHCSHVNGRCDEKSKPLFQRQCKNVTCGSWIAQVWSQCSSTCGEGIRSRDVSCVGGTVCLKSSRPDSRGKCQGRVCSFDMLAQNQTFRNHSDGRTLDKKKTEYHYVHERPKQVAADIVYQPSYEIADNEVAFFSSRNTHGPPPGVAFASRRDNGNFLSRWKVSEWSQCSSSCDAGYRIRRVRCVDRPTGQPSFKCDRSRKPIHRQNCLQQPCPVQ